MMRTKCFLLAFFLLIVLRAGATSPVPFDMDLWPAGLPNSNGMESLGYDDSKKNFKPSVRVFLPVATEKPAKAVVICPGGGYSNLALSHEGYGWAPFFNEQGMAAIVLKYRLPNGHHEVPASDAMEAIRVVKEHAAEWNIDAVSIGIMGSSAGGHLASTVATHAPAEVLPAFQILFYPVILMDLENTHAGSRKNLLGDDPSEDLERLYCNDLQVSANTPPAFITHSDDDKVVKPINSVKYYMALQQQGVSAAMFIYPTGGHGWGIRPNFLYHQEILTELSSWLKNIPTNRGITPHIM